MNGGLVSRACRARTQRDDAVLRHRTTGAWRGVHRRRAALHGRHPADPKPRPNSWPGATPPAGSLSRCVYTIGQELCGSGRRESPAASHVLGWSFMMERPTRRTRRPRAVVSRLNFRRGQAAGAQSNFRPSLQEAERLSGRAAWRRVSWRGRGPNARAGWGPASNFPAEPCEAERPSAACVAYVMSVGGGAPTRERGGASQQLADDLITSSPAGIPPSASPA